MSHPTNRKNSDPPLTASDFLAIKRLVQLASFTELNPRPVVETDLKGNVIYLNKSANSIFPDIRKKGAKHPYLANLAGIVRFLKKGEDHFSRDIKVADRWYRHFFYYLPHSSSIVVYGTDITDRKEYEEALKKNERRYHMLFDKMNYGYALQDIVWDTKGKLPADYRFVEVNPAFEHLAKIAKGAIVGKTVNEISKNNPKTEENIANRKLYDNVALTGKPVSFESYNEKLGRHFKIYAYKPNINQISLIFSDVTEEKKREEEKNNFIAILSHELRNPLTPILANTQFIQTILEKDSRKKPAVVESLRIIEKQAKIMADLLNDILDVSRMSQHKLQLQKRTINICEIIKNTVKAALPLINIKNQKLSVAFGRSTIHAYADPLRIEQVFMNLLSNASKYTPSEGHIRVNCEVWQRKVRISVKDNGVGMNKKKMARIFDLFNDQSKPFMGVGGLGIGLNVAKNLVMMHKGNINVRSAGKNKGAEFIVTLPLARKSEEIPAKPVKKAGKKSNAQKILVVDDSRDILQAVANIFKGKGYTVKVAGTGRGALKISKAFKPDVALIDIGLPDISGYRVAEMIRKQNGNKTRLIAFSGYGQDKDKKAARQVGFENHLTKPVDINQLVRVISSGGG